MKAEKRGLQMWPIGRKLAIQVSATKDRTLVKSEILL
jgi:hypothetical protein